MPVKTRIELRDKFQNGDVPDEIDFSNVFDSFIHQNDGIYIDNTNVSDIKVGIGIPNPTKKLHIQGNMLIDGTGNLMEAKLSVKVNNPFGGEAAEFKDGNEQRLFISPKNLNKSYNDITKENDVGIFWSDRLEPNSGGKNADSALVIAPHNDAEGGLRIHANGKLSVKVRNSSYAETAEFAEYDGQRLFIAPKNLNQSYNPITIENDVGIFWSDERIGNKNDTSALVIAPHHTEPTGLRVHANGRLEVNASGLAALELCSGNTSPDASVGISFKQNGRANTARTGYIGFEKRTFSEVTIHRIDSQGNVSSGTRPNVTIDSILTIKNEKPAEIQWKLGNTITRYPILLDAQMVVKQGTDTFDTISDKRLKEDIKKLSRGLKDILKLTPRTFKYLDKDEEQIGLVAQEVRDVIPGMVYGIKGKEITENKNGKSVETEDEVLLMNASCLKYIMINAIKELNEKIVNLENKINGKAKN